MPYKIRYYFRMERSKWKPLTLESGIDECSGSENKPSLDNFSERINKAPEKFDEKNKCSLLELTTYAEKKI